MGATARDALAFGADRRLTWAQVAQLVEHATENRSVGGSIPSLGTIARRSLSGGQASMAIQPHPIILDLV